MVNMMKKPKLTERRRKITSESVQEPEPVAFQVRFDADLHEQVKAAAETAGISVNQLIQGICRGAMAHLVQGEPEVLLDGFVRVNPQRGCVFFGRAGIACNEEEVNEYYSAGKDAPAKDNGMVWYGLDFTNRGFVRYQPK